MFGNSAVEGRILWCRKWITLGSALEKGGGPVEYEDCRIVQRDVHAYYDKKDKDDRSHIARRKLDAGRAHEKKVDSLARSREGRYMMVLEISGLMDRGSRM